MHNKGAFRAIHTDTSNHLFAFWSFFLFSLVNRGLVSTTKQALQFVLAEVQALFLSLFPCHIVGVFFSC